MMSNCKECGLDKVPYIVYEASAACMERQLKRLWIVLIASITLLFAISAISIYAWLQYDYVSEETIYQQDGEGTNIIGNSNEVDNYGAENDNQETKTH